MTRSKCGQYPLFIYPRQMFKSYRLYLFNHFGRGGALRILIFLKILCFEKIGVLNMHTELFKNMYKTAAAVYMDLNLNLNLFQLQSVLFLLITFVFMSEAVSVIYEALFSYNCQCMRNASP